MSFKAQITANIDGFSKAVDQAAKEIGGLQKTVEQRLSSLGDSFLSVGKKASVFSAGVAAASTGLFAFAKNTGDMANNLLSATVALDSSADILQEYKLVSIEAGTSADAFSRSVEALTRRLKDAGEESDNVSKYIKSLGVSLFDASGNMRRTGDITNDIIKSLAQMENVSQRNVIASQLFSRAWVDIAPILDLGADGIDNIRQNAHDLGIVLDGDALNAANNFSVSVNKMGLQLRAIKDNLASEIAPLLSDTIVPIIEERVIPAISSMAGRIGELVKSFNELPQGTKEAIMAITGVAAAIGPALVGLGGLLKILPLIGTAVTALTGPVGLVVAAIAGAAALIISNWDEIKAYFTTGGGAEMFNILKSMAIDVKDEIVGAFNMIKNAVKYIWEAIGSDIVRIFGNAFNMVMTALELLVKTFRNVAQILHGIFTLDFKFALDGLKNLFVDLFDGIKRILFNAVSTISSTLAGLFDLVGLDKWADGLRGFSDKLKPSISGIAQTASEASTKLTESSNAIDQASASAVIAADNVDKLTDSVNKLNDAQSFKPTTPDPGKVGNALAGLNISPTITPEIDTSLIKNAMGDLSAEIQVITLDIQNMLTTGIADLMGAVSDAIVNGDNVMQSLGASMLGTVGKIMVDLGKLAIGIGIGLEGIKKAFESLNPIAAIAAGAALIALGSMFTATSRKMGNNIGGSSGSYSGGTSSYNNVTSPGASEYRGAYQDDFVVTFVQKGSDLVGVLDTAEQRRYRL